MSARRLVLWSSLLSRLRCSRLHDDVCAFCKKNLSQNFRTPGRGQFDATFFGQNCLRENEYVQLQMIQEQLYFVTNIYSKLFSLFELDIATCYLPYIEKHSNKV